MMELIGVYSEARYEMKTSTVPTLMRPSRAYVAPSHITKAAPTDVTMPTTSLNHMSADMDRRYALTVSSAYRRKRDCSISSRVNACTAGSALSVCWTSDIIWPSRSRRARLRACIGCPKTRMATARNGTTAIARKVIVGSRLHMTANMATRVMPDWNSGSSALLTRTWRP